MRAGQAANQGRAANEGQVANEGQIEERQIGDAVDAAGDDADVGTGMEDMADSIYQATRRVRRVGKQDFVFLLSERIF